MVMGECLACTGGLKVKSGGHLAPARIHSSDLSELSHLALCHGL